MSYPAAVYIVLHFWFPHPAVRLPAWLTAIKLNDPENTECDVLFQT